jgi:hypothetical protein
MDQRRRHTHSRQGVALASPPEADASRHCADVAKDAERLRANLTPGVQAGSGKRRGSRPSPAASPHDAGPRAHRRASRWQHPPSRGGSPADRVDGVSTCRRFGVRLSAAKSGNRGGPTGGYLWFSYGCGLARLLSRCSVGRSLLRLPGPVVVALYRTALPPGTDGEVVAQEGIARLKVALPALADRCRSRQRRSAA